MLCKEEEEETELKKKNSYHAFVYILYFAILEMYFLNKQCQGPNMGSYEVSFSKPYSQNSPRHWHSKERKKLV